MTFELQPEFFGGGSYKEKVYSDAKQRRVGRHVRIFPFDTKQDEVDFLCMQVEIYGVPYLSEYLSLYFSVRFVGAVRLSCPLRGIT